MIRRILEAVAEREFTPRFPRRDEDDWWDDPMFGAHSEYIGELVRGMRAAGWVLGEADVPLGFGDHYLMTFANYEDEGKAYEPGDKTLNVWIPGEYHSVPGSKIMEWRVTPGGEPSAFLSDEEDVGQEDVWKQVPADLASLLALAGGVE